MILVLEDQPYRQNWFRENLVNCTIVDNAFAAIRALQDNQNITALYLDHDLSDDHMFVWDSATSEDDYFKKIDSFQNTGYEVAKFLEQHPELHSNCPIYLHSKNYSGRKRMAQALRGRQVQEIPFNVLCKK